MGRPFFIRAIPTYGVLPYSMINKWGTNEDVNTVCMFACIYIVQCTCLYKQTYTLCIQACGISMGEIKLPPHAPFTIQELYSRYSA